MYSLHIIFLLEFISVVYCFGIMWMLESSTYLDKKDPKKVPGEELWATNRTFGLLFCAGQCFQNINCLFFVHGKRNCRIYTSSDERPLVSSRSGIGQGKFRRYQKTGHSTRQSTPPHTIESGKGSRKEDNDFVTKQETCFRQDGYYYLQDSGMCLRLVEGLYVTWRGARRQCASYGGDLVVLNTDLKQQSYIAFLKGEKSKLSPAFSNGVWIGLRVPVGKPGKWLDGSPLQAGIEKSRPKRTIPQCIMTKRKRPKKWKWRNCIQPLDSFVCQVQ